MDCGENKELLGKAGINNGLVGAWGSEIHSGLLAALALVCDIEMDAFQNPLQEMAP